MRGIFAFLLKLLSVLFLFSGLCSVVYATLSSDRQWGLVMGLGILIVAFSGLLWKFAKMSEEASRLRKYRKQQSAILKLSIKKGGCLTVTEAAAGTNMTVEDAEMILKRLTEQGSVEIKVSDSGVIVYRFPDVLYLEEKHQARSLSDI